MAETSKRTPRRDRRVLLARIAVVVGATAALEILCQTGVVSRLTIIPPSEMAAWLWHMMLEGDITAPLRQTLTNVAIAFGCAVITGFLFGAGVHALPRLRRTLDPLFASYYAIPIFAFYPLFIVIFGLNDIPLIAIGYLFAVVAMVMNTLNGLDRVPAVLLKVGRMHHLRPFEQLRLIVLPSAVPYIFTGIKLALAYAFIGVLAGEFILSSSGIGYSISYAYDGFDIRTMYALMLLVLLMVVTMNTILHLWESRLMKRREGR